MIHSSVFIEPDTARHDAVQGNASLACLRRRLVAFDLIFRALLAALLAFAVAAKVQDFTNGASSVLGVQFVLTHLLAVECEGVLAIWLLSGLWPEWCRRAALCFFILAGCIAAFKGETAEATCGCFGSVSVSPWMAFAIDCFAVAMLAGLARGAPATTAADRPRPLAATTVGSMFLGGVAFVLMAYGVAVAAFGSPDDAINWLSGERVIVSPRLVDLGKLGRGERKAIELELRNQESTPATIVGAELRCNGRVTTSLPLIVPPQSSRRVSLVLALNGSGAKFRQILTLYRSDGALRELPNCLVVANIDGRPEK